jgi:hypothetical protein
MNANNLLGSVVEFTHEDGTELRGFIDRIVTVEGPFKPHTDDESKWTAHVVVMLGGLANARYTGTYQIPYQSVKVVA